MNKYSINDYRVKKLKKLLGGTASLQHGAGIRDILYCKRGTAGTLPYRKVDGEIIFFRLDL